MDYIHHTVRWISVDGRDADASADLKACADSLSAEPEAENTKRSIAALLMVQCMEKAGWKARILQEIVLQD